MMITLVITISLALGPLSLLSVYQVILCGIIMTPLSVEFC